jgi:uncharacterized protein (TIGR03435 family)
VKRYFRFAMLALVCCGGVFAQLAFDAASIKPTPPDRPPFPYRVGPNSFSMRAILKGFIMQAYEVESYQVTGGPSWVESQTYDISAKAEGAADTHQIRMMLQTLLAERFQLKVHRETRTMSGYVLSVDKGGPKLPPAKTDVPPDSPGVIQVGGGIVARDSTIKHLALGLTLQLGEPVIDQTGIAGHYDFRLRFDDSDTTGAATATGIGSVFSAVREIGLKLEAKKLPVEVLVIDSVEPPSEN